MESPEDLLTIDTPENVAFGYTVAGIGSRFLAALVDTLIITILQLLASIVIASALALRSQGDLQTQELLQAWIIALAGLLAFAFYWGYYIFFELTWNGQSPGKRLFRLRVTRTNGMPVGPVESIIRNFVRVIDILPFAYGIGLIVMFIDRSSRRLGDLAAGTLVVYHKEEVTLGKIEAEQNELSRLASAQAPEATWPVERLGRDDLHMAEQFIRRRQELANAEQFADQVAARLAAKMEIDYRPVGSAATLQFIASVIRASQGREVQSDSQTYG